MSNGKLSEENCELHRFKRNNYFYGKLMLPEDFKDEQQYFNSKRHLINRLVHGHGLVCGLSVEKIEPDEKDEIKISFKESGVALDRWGHEIVVPVEKMDKSVLKKDGSILRKSDVSDVNKLYLYLRYKPCLGMKKVPSASTPSSSTEILCQSTRIEEDYEVVALTEKPCPGMLIHSGTARSKNGPDYIILAETASSNNDTYKDMCIEIVDKTGEGQVRTIKSYTGNDRKAMVDSDWAINPDETSGYIIRDTSLVCPELSQINESNLAREKIREWVKKKVSICPSCDEKDPKVFLVAIDKKVRPDGTLNFIINEDETKKYAVCVYNNKLLFDLLTCHILDFNNPHKTTAEQVGAPKSVDGVDNPGGDIDLKNENSITINPDNAAKTITIGETHSGRTDNPHNTTAEQVMALKSINSVGNTYGNPYVPNVDLVSSDESIEINPDNISNSIDIRTAQKVDGCATGVIIFPIEVLNKEYEISQWIDPQLGKVPISIILGIEQVSGNNIFIGDKDLISLSDAIFRKYPPVLLGAEVDPDEGKFRVGVKKAEYLGYTKSIRVRWWAFKPDKDLGEVTVVSIWISPSEATINTRGTQEFTATVIGPINTDVKWSVNPLGFGNITPQQNNTAIYTAPDTEGTCDVIATSVADDTKKASAKVTVSGSVIVVSIDPLNADLRSPYVGQYFYARLTNDTEGVDWNVEDSGGKKGEIEDLGPYGDGTYQAYYKIPKVGSGETVTNYVVATSRSDPSKRVKAQVIVYGDNGKRKRRI